MKRFGQIEIITAVIFVVTTLASPVGAAISWSGLVTPSDPSTWDSSTLGFIGNFLDGTLDITGGSDVIDDQGYIGCYTDVTGAVTVNGTGSTWTNIGDLHVGDLGHGTLDITDGGAVSNNNGIIGERSGTGEVTVDGANSIWTNSNNLYVGASGYGTLNITNGGFVSIAGSLKIDYFENGGDNFINMDTGGMLALFGDADDSMADFMALIEGTDAIRYWNGSSWADIIGTTKGLDYTLEHMSEGDLAGYTILTIPEPATMMLFGLGGVLLRRRRA